MTSLHIDNLLKKYSDTKNTELECRFTNIDIKSIKDFLNNSTTVSKEESINFIQETNTTNKIIKMKFLDGKKQGSEFYAKTKMGHVFINDCKVSLSTEEPISEFPVSVCKTIRIKYRMSVLSEELPGWVIDITLVKNVINISSDLKKDKDKMLYLTSDFIKDAPWDYGKLELEVEHTNKDKKLTSADINKVISYINNINKTSKNNYNDCIKKITSVIKCIKKPTTINEIANKVIELNVKNYFDILFPNITSYYLLNKADGVRTLLVIDDGIISCISSDVEELTTECKYKTTILDSEYVLENDTYYVFDILAFDGKSVVEQDTKTRFELFKHINNVHKKIVIKEYISLDEKYESKIKKMWEISNGKDKIYHVDGLIFTPKHSKYFDAVSWKWKPLSHMTIDFMVKKAQLTSTDDHIINYLFCGGNKHIMDIMKIQLIPDYKTYFPHVKLIDKYPMQFSPNDDPYAYIYKHPKNSKFLQTDIENNVCEFRRILKDGAYVWDLIRIRKDRVNEVKKGNYFGNSAFVAFYTWDNYNNPLDFENLFTQKESYFMESKGSIHKNLITCNSIIKGLLIDKYCTSARWIVDLACGKGQDIFRYSKAKVANALCMDIDNKAISELIFRVQNPKRERLNTKIYTKIMDLSKDCRLILKTLDNMKLPIGNFDVGLINFAFHYLCGNTVNINNFCKLVSEFIKDDGHIIITAFNGKNVFDLLKETKELEYNEGPVVKYSIKKKYTSDTLEASGQTIDVLLPFSAGKWYPEFLVNFDYLTSVMAKHKFVLVENKSFADILPSIKKETENFPLTEADKLYISLYHYIIFKKIE